MQVSFKFRFISTVTNRENDKQNDGNFGIDGIDGNAVFHAKRL